MIPTQQLNDDGAPRKFHPADWLAAFNRAVAEHEYEEAARLASLLRRVGLDVTAYQRPRGRVCGQTSVEAVFC